MNKVPKPVQFKGAHEMPYCTVSVASMLWNNTGSWRYLRPSYIEQIPACQAACPAAEPIERWLAHLEKGEVDKAWEALTTENPFPGLMGRVCFHPCERGCNRKDAGGAVAINMLERHLADEYGYKKTTVKLWRPESGKKIAVVGSGPSGLACAYFSARLGHKVTVYEKFPKPGGLFRYGIPEYRLPKAVVDDELKKLCELGIKFECGRGLDRDDIIKLAEKYDAVFAGIGAHASRPLGCEGEDAQGIMPALEFLKNAQLNLEANLSTCQPANLLTVVIGGGNSAVDAARTALRLGAKSVIIIYRRSRVEMPAFEDEISDAEDEGVKIELLAAPKKVISEGGRVKSLECIRMRLGDPDSSGRRRPVEIRGSEFNIPADLVLTAIGEAVDERFIPPPSPKFFFGGDMLDAPRTVVNAIGSGKYAAIEIDCRFSGADFQKVLEKIRIPETNYVRMTEYLNSTVRPHDRAIARQRVVRTEDLNTYYFDRSAPSSYPKTEINRRRSPNPFAEVHIAPDRKTAEREIERCMHCGHCTECDNCFIYCPDVSILKADRGYDINFDYCKGCGICVKECPRAAMEMGEEPTDL